MATKKLDKIGLSQVWSKIVELFVSKETGKGLSSNDYTTTEKEKLAGIAEGANKTVVDTALSSTSTNPIQNKAVDAELKKKATIDSPTFTGVPKAPTPEKGTNDTRIATTAFVASAIATAVGSIQGISFSIVEDLPETGQEGVIYLVSNGGINKNVYDEYIWVNATMEKIGTTEVDLSGYMKTADLVDITEDEINEICVIE